MANLSEFPLFPGEHLISRIARFHWLSGNINASYTRDNLGILKGAFKAQNVLNDTYESVVTISLAQDNQALDGLLSEHSLFNHFRIGSPNRLIQSRIRHWRTGSLTHGVQRHALNDRMITINKHWRSCPACIDEDFRKFGIAYWHASHQIPGLNFCTTHRAPLWNGCPDCGTCYSTLNELALPEMPCACIDTTQHTLQPSEFQGWLLNSLPRLSKCESACIEKAVPTLKTLLRAPAKATPKNTPEINRIRDLVEEQVGLDELGQIFMYYRDGSNLFRGARRPNFVKAALYGPLDRVRHPIYYWILLYAANTLSGRCEWPVVA